MKNIDVILRPTDKLRHWTNRSAHLDLIKNRLGAPAGTFLPMLMFYGVGGAGKTTMVVDKFREVVRQSRDLPAAFITFDRSSGAMPLADKPLR